MKRRGLCTQRWFVSSDSVQTFICSTDQTECDTDVVDTVSTQSVSLNGSTLSQQEVPVSGSA